MQKSIGNYKQFKFSVKSFFENIVYFPDPKFPLFRDLHATRRNKKHLHLTQQYGCQLGVQQLLTYAANESYGNGKKRDEIPKDFLSFATVSKYMLPTEEVIKETLQKVLKKRMVLSYVDKNGKTRYFEDFRKGSARYNKVYECKIRDEIETYQSSGMQTYALTLTYDIKTYGEDRFQAWKKYNEHIKYTLENLRKHNGAKYVVVKESTKNGYPHAHILLAMPKGFDPDYKKLPCGKRLSFGFMYDIINKRVKSKVFELQKVIGNNLKYYMSKYISKFDTTDFFSLANKKEPLTEEELKALYCYMFTSATKTRQFMFCRFRKNNKEEQQEDNTFYCKMSKREQKKLSLGVFASSYIGDDDLVHQSPLQRKDARRLRRFLIKLCNNSPFDCKKYVNISTYETFREFHKGKIRDFRNASAELQEKYQRKTKTLGCKGCLYSEIADFVKGNFENALINPEITVNGQKIRPFNKKDLKDDYIYMLKLCIMVKNYYTICFVPKYSNLTTFNKNLQKKYILEKSIEELSKM